MRNTLGFYTNENGERAMEKQEPYIEKRDASSPSWIQQAPAQKITSTSIAIGVCIGIVTANAVQLIAGYAWANIEIQYAEMQMRQAVKQAQEQSARQQAQQQLAEHQRLENIAAQQRAQAAQRMAEINAQTKKEDAWKAYYQRDRACDDNQIDSAMFTKCANDAVKARTTFEATYKP